METVLIYSFPLGTLITHKSKSISVKHKSISTRSNIMTFSNKSSNRLKSLVIQTFENKPLLGITLTIPYKLPLERFKLIRRAFFQQIKRFNDSIRLIYRVEQQKNGNPHIHLITDDLSQEFIFYVQDTWIHYFESVENTAFMFNVQMVQAAQGFNYLIAHTSKHKKSQLGYAGRQWGAIGCNKRLKPSSVASMSLDYYRSACRTFAALVRRKYHKTKAVKLSQKMNYYYNNEFQEVLRMYQRLEFMSSQERIKRIVWQETIGRIVEQRYRVRRVYRSVAEL